MPIQIQIEDKTKSLERLANQLSDKNLNKANVRAINKAIQKANTNYRRELVKNYNLKYAETKDMISPKRATYGQPEGIISGRTQPIGLSHFTPSFIKEGSVFSIKSVKDKETKKRSLSQRAKKASKKDTYTGVSFEIRKGQRKTLPFAFMIQSDKPGIMQQIWARGAYSGNTFTILKSRKPITALKTLSPFGGITTEDTQKTIEESAGADMQKEFERQVNLLLRQAGAK
ncbi:MAG: phage tail protein [Chitinophagaceae bacterium]|nr:phage tail protein [Chitinophagaceae bacterium]